MRCLICTERSWSMGRIVYTVQVTVAYKLQALVYDILARVWVAYAKVAECDRRRVSQAAMQFI